MVSLPCWRGVTAVPATINLGHLCEFHAQLFKVERDVSKLGQFAKRSADGFAAYLAIGEDGTGVIRLSY